jgi:hypothetical protein
VVARRLARLVGEGTAERWGGYAVPMAVWAGSEQLIFVPGSGSQP